MSSSSQDYYYAEPKRSSPYYNLQSSYNQQSYAGQGASAFRAYSRQLQRWREMQTRNGLYFPAHNANTQLQAQSYPNQYGGGDQQHLGNGYW
ncbi:maker412 [Drosophila busckii]|uniref:Maker412 n=1 Tax=Drosophila busckii TaxID=30019 RepID=A0A0M4EE56_DROBS|nr:maker412 [Drosophila busckii]